LESPFGTQAQISESTGNLRGGDEALMTAGRGPSMSRFCDFEASSRWVMVAWGLPGQKSEQGLVPLRLVEPLIVSIWWGVYRFCLRG